MEPSFEDVAAKQFGTDREGYDYRYVVVLTNDSGSACQVDLFHDGDNKWLNGNCGTLLGRGETKMVAIPDWSWMAWGGPFRVLNHIQDHPISALVHRDSGESSIRQELRPWSTLTVTTDGITVAHADPAEGIEGGEHDTETRTSARGVKWSEFIAQNNETHKDYSYKYIVHIKNDGTDPLAAEIIVPADQHKLGEERKVGLFGIFVGAGEQLDVIVPDFSWMGQAGPGRRVLKHIQEQPVTLSIRADRKQGAEDPLLFSANVTSGCKVSVGADGKAVASVGGFKFSPAPPKAPESAGGASSSADTVGNTMVLPPAWLRGEMEEPAGERDMGSWIKAVFTEEQQARLSVDEMGQPVEKPAAALTGGRPPLTTHVLDTSTGKPAEGLPIMLEKKDSASTGGWKVLGSEATNSDGRLSTSLFPAGEKLLAETYRITFDTGAYFKAQGKAPFYPEVTVVFTIPTVGEHYHIPLLLSPFGYQTYRGS
jgi:5-hydroxyisourate hydrolase